MSIYKFDCGNCQNTETIIDGHGTPVRYCVIIRNGKDPLTIEGTSGKDYIISCRDYEPIAEQTEIRF